MGCGSPHGGLQVLFNYDELRKSSKLPNALALPGISGGRWTGSLKDAWIRVREELLKQDPDDDPFGGLYISVPIGSEVYLAQTLRASPLIKEVRLPTSTCAIADARLIVMKKELFLEGGVLSDMSIQSTIEAALATSLQQRPPNWKDKENPRYRLGELKITYSPIPPHMPVVRIVVYADSSVTRRVSGSWDKFNLFASFTDNVANRAEEISAVLSVERLFSISKGGSTNPPDGSWFKTLLGEDVEATVEFRGRLKGTGSFKVAARAPPLDLTVARIKLTSDESDATSNPNNGGFDCHFWSHSCVFSRISSARNIKWPLQFRYIADCSYGVAGAGCNCGFCAEIRPQYGGY
jgi:hypothetical protein